MNFMEFEDNGRTLTCQSASSPATPGTSWWWLKVTGESQRYAAFRTEAGDTPENLRPRIVAYYEQLLVDRARPRETRLSWAERAKMKRTAAQEGTAAAVETPTP
jgi:hypothetical protein